MESKKALRVAAGISAAVFAAATAIGVNVGILNSAAGEDGTVGTVSADDLLGPATTAESTPPETIVVDEFVTDAAPNSDGAPTPSASELSTSAPTASAAWPPSGDSTGADQSGDHYTRNQDDDDHGEDGDHEEDDHGEDDEHEGQDDDD
jgi:hypothetical protein